MKRIYVKSSFVFLMILFWLALPMAVQAQLPVNSQLMNGDFETGDLSGWMTGGTQNYSVSPALENGNYMATLEVGEGPIGDQSCTNPSFNNFAYLDQLFTLSKNHCVELDFHVPLPAISDGTEDATCSGFDRVELDFVLVEQEPYSVKMSGVVTIDYIDISGEIIGRLQVNDFVLGTVSSVVFDPMMFTPTAVGPLSLRESTALRGWLHASMEVSTSFFSWLPDRFTFRVTARLEDNRYTGQDFSLAVDNVQEWPGPCGATIIDIDIKPCSACNPINVNSKGVLPVAVLGTESFDIMVVDPSTLFLTWPGITLPPGVDDGAHPLRYAYEDVNEDGLLDIVLKFSMRDLYPVTLTKEPPGELMMTIIGKTYDGTRLAGQDLVRIINKAMDRLK